MNDNDSAVSGPQAALHRLGQVDRALAFVERQLLGLGIILMAINTIANVVARVGFNKSFFFSEELNQFLIVLVTFIGLSTAARAGRHIRMAAFFDMLPLLGRKILMTVICVVTAAIMFLLAYYAVLYLQSLASVGRLTPALRVPVYLTYIWIPIGLVVTGLQYTAAAIANVIRPGVYLSLAVEDEFVEGAEESPHV